MLVLKVAMSVLQEKLKIGTCAGTVQFAFETYLYRICEIWMEADGGRKKGPFFALISLLLEKGKTVRYCIFFVEIVK